MAKAEIILGESGGSGDKVYTAKATSSAEVKAWDGASFANNIVTITLPFEPKYIYTWTYWNNGSNHWVNTWDADISPNYMVVFGETNTPTIGQSAAVYALPNQNMSWIKTVSGNTVELWVNESSATLLNALFIAVG